MCCFPRENRQMEDELRQPRKECSSAITISFQTEKTKKLIKYAIEIIMVHINLNIFFGFMHLP